MTETETVERRAPVRIDSPVTIDTLVAFGLALVGLWIGLDSLHDNSFFTHLATGQLILEDGGIPRSDPYSFTAFGESWTVQSWGASVIYAAIDQVAGLTGIRAMVALCTMGLALLVWRLTKPAELLVGRLALAVPPIAIGSSLWVERPLLFGLLFLGAVLLAIEGDLDPRWMVPVMWVWVNVHGSFPLGLVAIGAYGLGQLLDRQRPTVELRVMGWSVLGVALGMLNPLGVRLLLFPFDLLSRREAFSQIVEWQSPTWNDLGEQFFALQLVVAVVLVLWRDRRWRSIVPIVIFGAASLQSTRNIVQASLVMLPAMAVAAKGLGTIDGRRELRVGLGARVAGVAVLVLVFVGGLSMPDTDLQDYPVASAEWMRDEGLLTPTSRVVSRDFVGNWMTYEYGPDEVKVFLDDRVDMYPISVIADYTTLIDPDGDYQAVLERAGATAVLWDTESPLASWLDDPANGWEIVHTTDLWVVAVPSG